MNWYVELTESRPECRSDWKSRRWTVARWVAAEAGMSSDWARAVQVCRSVEWSL